MSFYADHITTLAPAADPAHVEAWMRLEHSTLDGLSSWQFAREVQTALSCIEAAGLNECDKLAHSFGLQPQPRYNIGDRVLVAREGGLEPAGAVIDGENEHRPHLVKVKYLDSRTGAWIARKRIVGPVNPRPVGPGTMTEPRDRRRAWKPDATGTRCLRCARTFGGHAGRSCYPVPDAAIDAFDPPRPDLLEHVDDVGCVPQVLTEPSRTATAGPRDRS